MTAKRKLGQRCDLASIGGFTLVELVISIVILGIALLAIVTAMSTSVGRSSDVLLQGRSIQLAQGYFDEILTKRFDDSTGVGGVPPVTNCSIGAEAGETRDTFDDVDDYNGVDDQPPISQTGLSLANYGSFRVQVSVSCTDAANELGVSANMAKRITLTVTDPQNQQMQFSAYRGNF